MAPRTYWLDFYKPQTWRDSDETRHEVGGFRANTKVRASRVAVGDYFVCYVSQPVGKFVGVVEARSRYFLDYKKKWDDETWPVRFDTKLLWKVAPDAGLSLESVLEHGGYKGPPGFYVRPTLKRLTQADGEFIVDWFKGMAARGLTTDVPLPSPPRYVAQAQTAVGTQ